MGHMKNLDIRLRSGGDDAVAAACELVPQWIALADREPGLERVIVARTMPNGCQYVDVIAWVPEHNSGLPPLPSKAHVTHWMPLPDPPAP